MAFLFFDYVFGCWQWANLRAKKNEEKKLAVTIFSFPPDKGNVGTAAYLDVFGSIHTVLTKLRKEVRQATRVKSLRRWVPARPRVGGERRYPQPLAFLKSFDPM